MFPLTSNEAYIKSTGERSTLGRMLEEGGNEQLEEKLDNEIETRAALGAHNLIPTEAWGSSRTHRDVTFTVNSDGTIDVNGTVNVSQTVAYIGTTSFLLKKGAYKISGCPQGGGENQYRLQVWNATSSTGIVFDDGSGASFTLAQDTNVEIYVYAYKAHGTFEDLKFEPMIRLATDSDTTYQPYAMTNKELTDTKADRSDLASISITGTTNNTGSTIASGTYFYLNGALVKAKTSIANGATLTANTNYEAVTAGGLNDLKIKYAYIAITAQTISAGESYTYDITSQLPAGLKELLAIIPISVGPTGWGVSIPAVFSGVDVSNNKVTVRAYTSGDYAPIIIILYY